MMMMTTVADDYLMTTMVDDYLMTPIADDYLMTTIADDYLMTPTAGKIGWLTSSSLVGDGIVGYFDNRSHSILKK